MWELDYKESWALKSWCFWTVVLEKTLESPLDHKEIQPVHSEGDESWVFIGRTDVETETPILWPPDVKTWLIGKAPDAGKDWGQEERGMTEDEMVGWHHRLDGHGFGWTPGVGDGQGGLACCVSGISKIINLRWHDTFTVSALGLAWGRVGALFISFLVRVSSVVTILKELPFNEHLLHCQQGLMLSSMLYH